jgi:glycerophosphoryl diester phosphodiesterase
MKNEIVKRSVIDLAIVWSIVVGACFGLLTLTEWYVSSLGTYRDVEQAFIAAGYTSTRAHVYEKNHHGLVEQITIDYRNAKAFRNGFALDIATNYFCYVRCLMQADQLEELILNEPYNFNMFGVRYAPLIAHAGGGYRTREKTSTYTNAYEAIAQNYGLGHRFFELDFELTTDEKLVAVHEWKRQDRGVSEHDWLMQPEGSEHLHHVAFTDVLELMLVQRDMFLITDSKVFEVDEAQRAAEFKFMYEAIMRYDTALLNRVIPQVYTTDMLEKYPVLSNFPHVILTGYAANMTRTDILAALDAHPQIQMFTTDILGSYIDDYDLVAGVKERARKLSIHTVNEADVFTDLRYVHVDGYYTDFLTPSDWRAWKLN